MVCFFFVLILFFFGGCEEGVRAEGVRSVVVTLPDTSLFISRTEVKADIAHGKYKRGQPIHKISPLSMENQTW